MKFKKFTAILLASVLTFAAAGCGTDAPQVSSSADTGVTSTEYELKDEISQADWDDNRQYVKLNTGITMSYVEMGDAEGKPVILQHGMTDNSRVWSLTAPYLAKQGYHVYMPDLRGHGYSDKPDDGIYTISDYSQDLNAFMEAMNIEKADLVGHSLGSMTMQMFMLLYPEKCEHVMLVASTPVDEEADSAFASTYEMALDLKDDEHPSDEFIEEWYTNPNPVDEEFLSYVKKESQQLPASSWRAISAGISSEVMTNMYQFIDQSIPVMIIHGTADSFFSDDAQTELQQDLPNAKYVAYDGIGHNVEYEVPERLANEILEFIN